MEIFSILFVLCPSESHYAAHSDLKLTGSSDLSEFYPCVLETGTAQDIQFK